MNVTRELERALENRELRRSLALARADATALEKDLADLGDAVAPPQRPDAAPAPPVALAGALARCVARARFCKRSAFCLSVHHQLSHK